MGLCLSLAATGCSKDFANRDVYEESGNTTNVNNQRYELYDEGGARNVSHDYGFVRHQKSPVANDQGGMEHYSALDREQVANIISKLSTDTPNVYDVATLVTDQEVLVVYSTDSKDRNLTADQVKRTAMSVVPRYYHVYVSDNQRLVRDVENLANLDSTSKNARNAVTQLITEMKKSPQGANVDSGENANGETQNETNPLRTLNKDKNNQNQNDNENNDTNGYIINK